MSLSLSLSLSLHTHQARENAYFRKDYIKKKTKQQNSPPDDNAAKAWQQFCDFPEISHITLTGVAVCISTQDNHTMVR